LQEAGPQEATGCQETHEGSSDKGEQETSYKNTLEAAQKMTKERVYKVPNLISQITILIAPACMCWIL